MDFATLVEKTKNFLNRRQWAYKKVFNPEDEAVKIVVKDLSDFCRAIDSTFHVDPRMHAILEGRREVWLRIEKHLNLDQKTLWKTYGRKDIE